jgi:phage terminase small subunit
VGLTYKQILFVEAYLGDANGNASEAARIAGYGSPGTRGHELVKNREVQARIQQRVAAAAMPANEVLARLSEFAAADIGDFLDVDEANLWRVNLWKAKRGGRTRLIKKVKQTKDGTEIELHSPADAIDKLMKHHGLYKDRLELSGGVRPTFQSFDDGRDPDLPPPGETA